MEIRKPKQTVENLFIENGINFNKKRLKNKDKSKKLSTKLQNPAKRE